MPGTNDTLEGAVARVVYRAPDGAFAVVRLSADGRAQPVTVIGPLTETTVGERLRLEGTWEKHPVHGEQFRAQRAVSVMPRTASGVARYLEGLKGIGPELSRRLVVAFGTRAIEVLEDEPWRAAQVKGMGKRRAERVAREAQARKQEREVMVFLQGLGVSLAYATRIQRTYGGEAIAKVRQNPYRLARDVSGIGFQVADRIARGMGIAKDAPERIEAGVLHALDGFADEGHSFAARAPLLERSAELLDVEPSRAEEALSALALAGAVIKDGEAIYAPWLYRAELEVAKRAGELLRAARPPAPVLLEDELARLSPGQAHALAQANASGLAVITGGPGTGKTTVVRALTASWERAGRRVLLAAPTGRAAKRLHEATGRPAQTVHRLLEWGRPPPGVRRGPFARDETNRLAVDLLVVDEASMLDLGLFRALIAAVPPGATLVLVGDVDQLPPVGPGQVLADLISSEVVPVARLSEIFRQAEGSGIIDNAYRILDGTPPVGAKDARGDFFLVHAEEPERARELVVRMCKERIPSAFGLDPIRDVQVLTPMHRGAAGSSELNRALQDALNPASPEAPEVAHAGRTFRAGDKVMQVKNDYDRDVFNGDVGRVVSAALVEDEPVVEIELDGRRVRYEGEALAELELAYAVTVHKSQGSEYPAVVLTLLMQHFVLLKRNLLYTAVTRGKRLVVVVGSERALERAAQAGEETARASQLAARLAEAAG
ncbi:MAG TPA: ATP-dependent RecD-like DNA helicase [Polyangia bacterium]